MKYFSLFHAPCSYVLNGNGSSPSQRHFLAQLVKMEGYWWLLEVGEPLEKGEF